MTFEISSSHGGEYEAQNLLGCTAVFLIECRHSTRQYIPEDSELHIMTYFSQKRFCTSGFDPRRGQRIFPLSSVSRPALGPTQPVQWVPGVLSPGVKARPGRDADHSPHLVPRSRMSRSYTSSPPSSSMACSGTALPFFTQLGFGHYSKHLQVVNILYKLQAQ
jgi:hypothetical protein